MDRTAFTLVEILIVISLVGMLLAMTTFGYGSIMKNSRDTERRVALSEIATALEKYKDTNGKYPASLTDLISPVSYLQEIPHDPRTTNSYEYTRNDDASSFILVADLELVNEKYILTPQGPLTIDVTVTPQPTQTTNDDPVFPTNLPTLTITVTPTVVYPTSSYGI